MSSVADLQSHAGVELLEVAVDRYKSLERLVVPWSSKLVVLGKNGCGKTTLFEAITLVCGSRASLWQIAPRAVDPDPGSIRLLTRCAAVHLPVPPELIGSGTAKRAEDFDGERDLVADRDWWGGLGAERGIDWADALRNADLPDALTDLLITQSAAPLVRHRLERLSGLENARRCDRGAWYRSELEGDAGEDDQEDEVGRPTPHAVRFTRLFSACLALPAPLPEWLCELAEDLPEAFAPLRSWVAARPTTDDAYVDVLELPPASRVPIVTAWLAAERSTDEACFDLQDAFELASRSATALTLNLDRLPLRAPEGAPEPFADARWWLSVRAIDSANEVLRGLGMGLELDPNSDTPDSAYVSWSGGTPGRGTEMLCQKGTFEQLSAGERVWLDIALAWASAELEHLSMLNEARDFGLLFLRDEALLDRALELSGKLDVETEGFWNAADIEGALAVLDRFLLSLDAHPLGDLLSRSQQTQGLQRVPALRALLDPPLRVRLIDEPERHLHAAAQRTAYELLDRRMSGTDVALATHSQYFLRQRGWAHRHLSRSPEGTVVASFEPAELSLQSAATRELGWDHGELLAWDRYVLFVEGPTDQLVAVSLRVV